MPFSANELTKALNKRKQIAGQPVKQTQPKVSAPEERQTNSARGFTANDLSAAIQARTRNKQVETPTYHRVQTEAASTVNPKELLPLQQAAQERAAAERANTPTYTSKRISEMNPTHNRPSMEAWQDQIEKAELIGYIEPGAHPTVDQSSPYLSKRISDMAMDTSADPRTVVSRPLAVFASGAPAWVGENAETLRFWNEWALENSQDRHSISQYALEQYYAGNLEGAEKEAVENYLAKRQKAKDSVQELSDFAGRMQDYKQQGLADASYGIDTDKFGGKLAVQSLQALQSVSQNLLDVAAGKVLGIGEMAKPIAGANKVVNKARTLSNYIPFAMRSFGASAGEARRADADLSTQLDYAVKNTVKEVATEMMWSIGDVYGIGAADDWAESRVKDLVRKSAASGPMREVLSTAASLGMAFSTEAMEEVVGTLVEEFYLNQILDPNAEPPTGWDLVNKLVESGMVGGLSGMIMGGGNVLTQNANARINQTIARASEIIEAAENSGSEEAKELAAKVKENADKGYIASDLQDLEQMTAEAQYEAESKAARAQMEERVRDFQNPYRGMDTEDAAELIRRGNVYGVQGADVANAEDVSAAKLQQIAREVTKAEAETGRSETVRQAVQEAKSGTVSDETAERILNDARATEYFGADVTPNMTEAERSNVVKAAIETVAEAENRAAAERNTSNRATTQSEENASSTGRFFDTVKETLGESGQAAFTNLMQAPTPAMSPQLMMDRARAAAIIYNAGTNGTAIESIRVQNNPLTATEMSAMYSAGVNDGRQSGIRTGERQNDLAASERSREISQRARETRARRQGATVQRTAVRAAVENEAAVSTKEIGFRNGSDTKNLKVLPESAYSALNKHDRNAVEQLKKKGFKVVLMVSADGNGIGGLLEDVQGKHYRGAIQDGNTIFLSADHWNYTVEQIARHEYFHSVLESNEGLRSAIVSRLYDQFSAAEILNMQQAYAEDYNWSGVDADYVLDEILCDAFGGMDVFEDKHLFPYHVTDYAEIVREMAKGAEGGEGVGSQGSRFSIEKIVGEKGDHGYGVVLDTDIFDGISPRNWGKVLNAFVYNELAGTSLIALDENNNPEVISFARQNDRVWKDGARRPHKALDELIDKNRNIVRDLSIAHAPELIAVSKYLDQNNDNSHGWMDRRGWKLKKVVVQNNENGKIYTAQLNIARSDERNILFDISRIHQIDTKKNAAGSEVSSALSGGSRQASNSISVGTIAQSSSDGNNKSFLGSEETSTRFSEESLRQPVSETKDLLAVHNLTYDNIRDTIALGGMPSPSIAVVKAEAGHTKYGPVSFVFSKDTIDPKKDRRNKIYGSDAWTPTNPGTHYQVNMDRMGEIEARFEELSKNVADGAFWNTSVVRQFDMDRGQTGMNEHEIASALADNDAVKAAYLADMGRNIEAVYKAKQYNRQFDNELLQEFIAKIGADRLNEIHKGLHDYGGDYSLETAMGEDLDTVTQLILNHYMELRRSMFEKMQASKSWSDAETTDHLKRYAESVLEKKGGKYAIEDFVESAWQLQEDGNKPGDVIDKTATRELLDKAVDRADVEEWTRAQLDGLLGERGIRNDVDPYTPSGNRRGFWQLHYKYTLENILKAMQKTQTARGQGATAGPTGLQSVVSEDFGSIDEVRERKGRLQKLSETDYMDRYNEVQKQINEVIGEIVGADESYSAREIAEYVLMEAAAGPKSVEGIIRTFARESDFNISRETAEGIRDLFKAAAELPTEYFEAKPQRAVGFDEILAAVVPTDAPTDVVDGLREQGVDVHMYEANNDADRVAKLNSVEKARFSEESPYTYESLIAKPAMKVTVFDGSAVVVKATKGGNIDANPLVKAAKERSDINVGGGFSQEYVYVDDIKSNVLMQAEGIRHGIQGRITKMSSVRTAEITPYLPDILRNSIAINERSPRTTKDGENSFILIGYAETKDGDHKYIVRSTINRYADNRAIPETIEIYDVLKGAKAKKTDAAVMRGYTARTAAAKSSNAPASLTISIADLLELVKENYPEFLSEDVRSAMNIDVEPADGLKYSEEPSTFSARMQQSQDELERLQQDLALSQAEVAYWKRARTTGEHMVNRSDVKRVSGDVLKRWDSTLKTGEISDRMEDLADCLYRGMGTAEVLPLALEIADDICSSAKVIADGEAYETYKDIRKYFRENKIKRVDGIGDPRFYKRNFGKIRFAKEGRAVDEMWDDWQSRWGVEFFPDDVTTSQDKLLHLAEVIDSIESLYENPYSSDYAEAVEECAYSLMDDIMRGGVRYEPARLTTQNAANASAYNKAISEKNRQIEKLQKQNEKTEEYYKEREAKAKEQLRKVRERRDERIDELKRHYKEVAMGKKWRRAESDARRRLQRVAKRLQNKKLPAVSKALLGQYIDDLDTAALSITGKKLDELKDLQVWYSNKKATDPDFIANPEIEKKLARINKKRISELSIDEVVELTQVLLNIENTINTERQMIDSEDRRDIYAQGLETIDDIMDAKGTKADLKDWIVSNTLSPVRAVRRFTGYAKNSPLYNAVESLADGQRRMFDYQMRAARLFDTWAKDKKYTKSLQDEITISGFKNGVLTDVKITRDMAIALYMHAKNDQNLAHIRDGGVTIPDLKALKKDPANAYGQGAIRIKLSPAMVKDIGSKLTAKDKAYAAAAAKYFDTMAQDEINEVSEKLVGYSVAQVENYFPINTDANFTRKEFESLQMDGTIEGMGFLKERTDAKNPIYLRGFTDVLNKSIDMNSKYVGLAIPVRNFNKLWNVTTADYSDADNIEHFTGSVKEAMNQKWGKRGVNYIEKMMTDLQNANVKSDELDSLLGKVRSNYAGAVLTLNLSVAIKQAASYPTAGAVLGGKPLLKALANPKVDANTIAKYTPLYWYRSQGFADQELGDLKKRNKQIPKVLNWIQAADMATTRTLWKASEYYVRDNNKNLQVGSEEYYQEVARIYNRVIEETQPNYTTMQRPQLLRSDSSMVQSIAMFKTQPFQNFNVLYDAVGEYEALARAKKAGADVDLKSAQKNVTRAVASQVVQLAVFSAMTFIWNMIRRKHDKYEDEEGEMTAASTFKGIGKDMLSGSFSMVPFGSNLYELMDSIVNGSQYYGFDSVTITALDDTATSIINQWELVKDATGTIIEGGTPDWNTFRIKTKKNLNKISKLAGIPMENVNNLYEAAYHWAAIYSDGEYMGEYRYLCLTISPNSSKVKYYALLKKAWLNDQKAFNQLQQEMLDSGYFTEKGINQKIGSWKKEVGQ